MSSFPGVPTSNVFNTADYNIEDVGLTISAANKLYLSLGGGVVSGPTSFNAGLNASAYSLAGTPLNFSYITGITPGLGASNKALVLDTNLDITGPRNLGSQRLFLSGAAGFGLSHKSTSPGNPELISFVNTDVRIGTYTAHSLNFITSNGIKSTITSAGDFGIGNTSPSYKLDVNGAINGTSYLLGGVAADLSYLQVTPGTAAASKALVLDGSGAITGITSLDAAAYSLSGSPLSFSLIQGVTAGVAAPSKVLSFNSSSALVIGSTAGGSPQNAIKWIDATNTWSNEFSMYRIKSGSGLWLEFYQKDNLYATPSCLLVYLNGALIPNGSTLPYTAATMLSLRHRPTASTSLDFTTNLYSQIGSTPQIDGLGNSFSFNSDHDVLNLACGWGGGALRKQNNLAITTNGRMFFNTGDQITFSTWGGAGVNLNGNLGIVTNNSFSDGSVNWDTGLFIKTSNSNPVSFAFQLDNRSAATSTTAVVMGTCTNNDFRLMTNNSTKMIITNTGLLNYTGSASTSLGVGGSNVWRFDVQSGATTSLGIGPTSYTLSAVFAQPIKARYVYSDSDRRLKKDIQGLEMSEEHYMKFNPSIFRYKDEDRFSIGLIAQETLTVASELITFAPNPDMKVEDPATDVEGMSMSINYGSLAAVNVMMIKKLIKRIEILESKLARIYSI